MTAVSNSRRGALLNAYVTRRPCDLRRLPLGPPLGLTPTKRCPEKPGKSNLLLTREYIGIEIVL